MAESPPLTENDLKDKLGKDEYNKLLDERARLQLASRNPDSPLTSKGLLPGVFELMEDLDPGPPKVLHGQDVIPGFEVAPDSVVGKGASTKPPKLPEPPKAKPMTPSHTRWEAPKGTEAGIPSEKVYTGDLIKKDSKDAMRDAYRAGTDLIRGNLLQGMEDQAMGAKEVFDASVEEIPLELVFGQSAIKPAEAEAIFRDNWWKKLTAGKDIDKMSKETYEAYQVLAAKKAARHMAALMQSGMGKVYIDPFDEDVLKDINWWWKPLRPFRAMASPMKFGMTPTVDPNDPAYYTQRAVLSTAPSGLRSENALSQFGRASLWNAIEAWMRSKEEWGGDKHVQLLRSGSDYFDRTGDLADWLGGGTAGAIGSGGIMLALTLFDPDLFTAAGAPMGKTSRALKLRRVVGKLSTAEQMIKVADELAAGTIDHSKALEKIKEIGYLGDKSVGNAQRRVVIQNAAQKMEVEDLGASNFDSVSKDLLTQAATSRIKAKKYKEEAGVLLEKAETKGSLAKSRQLLLLAAAEEAAADSLALVVVEARKNRLLQLGGLTEEEAARIGKVSQLSKADKVLVDRAREALKNQKASLKKVKEETKEIAEAFKKSKIDLDSIVGSLGVPNPNAQVVFKKSDIVDLGDEAFEEMIGSFPAGRVEDFEIVNAKTGAPIPNKGRIDPDAKFEIHMTVLTDTGQKVVVRAKKRGKPILVQRADAIKFRDSKKRYLPKYVAMEQAQKRLSKALQGVEEAQNTVKTLQRGGVAYEAIKTYGKVKKARDKSQRILKNVKKSADRATKEAADELVKAGKKTIKAGRLSLKADTLERAPKVIEESIREVAQGMLDFRDRGLGILGAKKGAESSFMQIRKAAGKAGTSRIEEAFSPSAGRLAAEQKYEDLRKFTKVNRKKNTAEVDGEGILKELQESYGTEAFQKYNKERPGLAKALSKGKRELSAEELEDFQGSLRDFIRYGEASKSFDSEVHWGQQFLSTWNSSANYDPSYFGLGRLEELTGIPGLKKIPSSVAALVYLRHRRRVGTFGDPVLARTGALSPAHQAAFRAAEHLVTRFGTELLDVAYAKHLGDDVLERVETFMDWDVSKGPLNLIEGKLRTPDTPSEWSVATGPASAFNKGRWQMLEDTRIDPARAARIEKESEAMTTSAREEINKFVENKRSDLLKAGLSPEEVDDLAGAISDELLAVTIRAAEGGTSAQTSIPKALLGVSRSWVRTADGRIPPQQAAILMAVTVRLLKKEDMTYKAFMEKLKGVTRAVTGGVDQAGASHAFASANFGLAANLGHFNALMDRASFGTLTMETAADINRIWTGEIGKVEDMRAAVQAASKMGMPIIENRAFPEGVRQSAGEMQDATRKLVETAASGGRQVFNDKFLIDQIEASAGKIVKELEATRGIGKGPQKTIFSAAIAWTNVWKASATTGLLVPNPRYFMNNIFGDFSQMWTEVGFAKSATRTFSNLPLNIPIVGRRVQDWQFRLNEWAHKKGRKALPTITGALFNPNLGKVFRGEAGTIITKKGDAISYDALRTWAIEDGVISDFIAEDIIDLMSRVGTKIGKTEEAKKQWNGLEETRRLWARTREVNAGMIQHRQRMGLYADLLQSGYTRKEAAEATLRALYDWKHGITELEAAALAKIIPFYRFWRLSMKQVADSLLTPFTQPTNEALKNALLGNTRLARFKQQLLIWPHLPDIVYYNDPDAGVRDADLMTTVGREMYPKYLNTRASPGSFPLNQAAQNFFWREEGQKFTWMRPVLPQITAIDQGDMAFGAATLFALLAEKIGGGELAEDAEARLFEPILGTLSPALEPWVRGALSMTGVDLEYESRSMYRTLNAAEYDVMKQLPFFKDQIGPPDPETGKQKVPIGTYILYGLLPVASTQATSWSRLFQPRTWDPAVGGGAWKAFSEITGFMRGVPYDPEKEMANYLRTIDRIIAREVGKLPKQPDPWADPHPKYR